MASWPHLREAERNQQRVSTTHHTEADMKKK